MRILSILARPMPDRPQWGDLSFLAKGAPIGAVRTPSAPAASPPAAKPAGALPGDRSRQAA